MYIVTVLYLSEFMVTFDSFGVSPYVCLSPHLPRYSHMALAKSGRH